MHAVVGVWTQAGSDGLPVRDRAGVLPGFVQSFWALDHETGKLHSFEVFRGEDGARRLKDLFEAGSPSAARAGLSYDRLSIVEVKVWRSRP